MARFYESEVSPTFQIHCQNSTARKGRTCRGGHRCVWPTLTVLGLLPLGVVLLIYFHFQSGVQQSANPYFGPETKLRFTPVNGESAIILAKNAADGGNLSIRYIDPSSKCSTILRSFLIPRESQAVYGVTDDGYMMACWTNRSSSRCSHYNPYHKKWNPILTDQLWKANQQSAREAQPNRPQQFGLNVNIGGVVVNANRLVLQGSNGKIQMLQWERPQNRTFLETASKSLQFPDGTCLISVDSKHIIAVGGLHKRPMKTTAHFLVDKNQIFKGFPMPKLNHGRSLHGCTKVSLMNQTWLIAVSGTGNRGRDRNDVEMLPWKPKGYNHQDRWVKLKAELQFPRSQKPVVGLIGNRLFVAGGCSKTDGSFVEVFDYDSQKWTNFSIRIDPSKMQALQVNPSRCQKGKGAEKNKVVFPI
ncbi:uncharacterized protein LOC131881190 [Tigriopus californicus]|uniref:uncharacterized protein LOC131881190 n=1 Tax=Tigriopus californicus TaxID=6832 RepID=UPI0027DA6CDD|nr:uncharacterized protein LOC131881190 [Tigriopus californicus]